MTPEMIEAISKLWLLALILLIIICIILFKNQIRQLLESFTNLKIKGKHNNTELEVEGSFREQDNLLSISEQISSEVSEKSQPDRLEEDDKEKVIEADHNLKIHEELFFEMVSALEDNRDLIKGKEIYEKIQAQENDSSEKINIEIFYLYLSYNEAALNNIGVIYRKLSMLGQSINFFKKAVDKNNTLAAANLADMYMQAGFIEDSKPQYLNLTKVE